MSHGSHGVPKLTPEQVSRVDEILNLILDLPEERRMEAVGNLHTEDPLVNGEVDSLLKAMGASADFLNTHAESPHDDARSATVLGMRFGAWRITRLVGSGGMGDV